MKVIIRTDIGGTHGIGHASRMLTLARELQQRHIEVAFVTITEALRSYVPPFRCYMHSETAECIPGDVLVIDTKAADWSNDNSALWLRRDAGLHVVRIDHPHATPDSCDLLIGPCVHWDTETVARLSSSFGDRFLYGWDYVLLDPMVTNQERIPYPHRTKGPIVFTGGGSDPRGILQSWYDWTRDIPMETACVFLVGSHAAMLDPGKGPRASFSMISSFEREWLRRAAFVVGLFGQTTYECLYWDTPMLVYGGTEENTEGSRTLAKVAQYQCCHAGTLQGVTQAKFLDLFLTIYGATIRRVGERMPLFDGQGVARVATAMLQLGA